MRGTTKQAGPSLRWAGIMLLALALAGCAGAPKPTVVQAAIQAGAKVNPDARGRSSPVILRFYELKSLAAFSQADFFSLYERDKETLGAELVAREEFQIMPGEKKELTRVLQMDTRYIGVVAAFRDVERGEWRAQTPVPAGSKASMVIQLDGSKVGIAAR
jgi:type VI secretion system protein VasD